MTATTLTTLGLLGLAVLLLLTILAVVKDIVGRLQYLANLADKYKDLYLPPRREIEKMEESVARIRADLFAIEKKIPDRRLPDHDF